MSCIEWARFHPGRPQKENNAVEKSRAQNLHDIHANHKHICCSVTENTRSGINILDYVCSFDQGWAFRIREEHLGLGMSILGVRESMGKEMASRIQGWLLGIGQVYKTKDDDQGWTTWASISETSTEHQDQDWVPGPMLNIQDQSLAHKTKAENINKAWA